MSSEKLYSGDYFNTINLFLRKMKNISLYFEG